MISYTPDEWDQLWTQAVDEIMRRTRTLRRHEVNTMMTTKLKHKVFYDKQTDRYIVKDNETL